ncbi:hypothetical protein JXJ21_25900 [candidate division KSB1 bacterium]|nr:hypothetical protein [candidate division KSB1 bacterium]
MAKEQTYQRKVSAEEVQEGYIFILKDFIKFFPKPNVPFKLKVDGDEYDTHVEIVDCWCMGPNKPHVHYRISIRSLQGKFPIHRNNVVKFTRQEDGVYTLAK